MPLLKERRRLLTEELSWEGSIPLGGEQRVIATKDAAWFMCAEYRGPDLEHRDARARFHHMSQFNNAMLRYGAGYAFWLQERHDPYAYYPALEPADEAAWLFEAERAYRFRESRHYHRSRYYLTMLYRPPPDIRRVLGEKLIRHDPDAPVRDFYGQNLDRFREEFDALLAALGFLPMARPLLGDELWTYLHSTISPHAQEVTAPMDAEALPGPLADASFAGGLRPAMGEDDDRVELWPVHIRNYPRYLEPGLMRVLRDLPVRWAWTSRWYPQDEHESDKEIARAWSRSSMTAKSPMASGMQALGFGGDFAKIDPVQADMMFEADQATREMRRGLVKRGYLTNSVTIMAPASGGVVAEIKAALRRMVELVRGGAAPQDAAEEAWPSHQDPHGTRSGRFWAHEVTKKLRAQRLVCQVENLNAAETVLGAVPGNLFADPVQHALNSAAMASVAPIDAPDEGTPVNDHFGVPALMQVTRGECGVYHLDLHTGDVGHTLLTGWTGGGKTTKVHALVLAFRARQARGRVFAFTKRRASKALCYALDGRFIDPMRDGRPLQPLRFLETPVERARAYRRVRAMAALVDAQEARREGVLDSIADSVDRFARSVDPDDRTMTIFARTSQDPWLQGVLRPYTKAGAYGMVFDGVDRSSWEEDVVMVEVEDILEDEMLTGPVANLMFDLALRRADPGRPLLMPVDECQNLLRPPFDGPLEEIVREGRARNIQLVMISQDFEKFAHSAAARIFVGNCPTRIFIPDEDAAEPSSMALLQGYGLAESQVRSLASASAKGKYAVQRKGLGAGKEPFAIYDLTLDPVGRCLCATTGADSAELAEKLMRRHGRDGFLHAWLRAHGQDEAAAALPRQPKGFDDAAAVAAE